MRNSLPLNMIVNRRKGTNSISEAEAKDIAVRDRLSLAKSLPNTAPVHLGPHDEGES